MWSRPPLVCFLGLLVLASGCQRQVRAVPLDPLVAGVIPGCPATSEGAPSECSWRRAIWAAEVWEEGGLDLLIASGGAVHNRFVEAQVTKAALVALGVPEQRVVTETQALHTDENIAYSLDVAEALGMHRLVGISENGQAVGICQMALMWGWECDPAPMQVARVRARVARGLPAVSVEPVPEDEWTHWTEREKELRAKRGEPPRLRSPARYLKLFMAGMFGGTVRKPEPPEPEPTLPEAFPWVTASR